MAGSGDLAPLLIIVEEVFKLLLLTAVKLCFLPLRWLHPRKQQMYATGTAFITGCDTGIGRATAVMLADKVNKHSACCWASGHEATSWLVPVSRLCVRYARQSIMRLSIANMHVFAAGLEGVCRCVVA